MSTKAENRIYTAEEQKKAAYALNLCTVSISQIIDYDDVHVLEQEYHTILNNLNLEQIPKDEALLDVLKQILDVITFFRISEGDRDIIDLEYQNRMKSAIWSAIPSVGAIFVTSNPLAIGLTLATQVGTGYMNYRRNRAEYQLGREKAEWQLKRAAMEQLNGLRKELFETSWRLATEYDFPDEFRLTDQQIHEYDEILMDENAIKRFNKLHAIRENFAAYPPYWYQLGSTANSIYRNDELGLDPYSKSEYYQHAIDAFEKYHELNHFNILRHDTLTSSWALEYVDLLDVTCDSGRKNAHELITLAEKYSGNLDDILELCAYAYLKINDRENAARLFYVLVNNDYNIAVNARILSAIYIQNMRSEETRESALRNYNVLPLIADSRYILPLPSVDMDLEKWKPEWEEDIKKEPTSTSVVESYSAIESLIGNRYKISESLKVEAVKSEFIKEYAPNIAEKSIIGMMLQPIVLFTTWGIHFVVNGKAVAIAYKNIDFSKTTATRTDTGKPLGTNLRLKGENDKFYLNVENPEEFLELLQEASQLNTAPSDTIESLQSMSDTLKITYGKLLIVACQHCELDWVETIRFAHDLKMSPTAFESFLVYAHETHTDAELNTLSNELNAASPYPNEENIAYALIQSMVALIQFSSGRCRSLTVKETNFLDDLARMFDLSKEVVDQMIPVAQIPYRILKKDITEKEITGLGQALATVAAGVGVPAAVVLGNGLLYSSLWWFPLFFPGVGTIVTAGIVGIAAVTKLFGRARKKEAKRMEKSWQKQLVMVQESYLALYRSTRSIEKLKGFTSLLLKAAEKVDVSIAKSLDMEIKKDAN